MPDLTIYEQVATATGAKVIATVLHDNGDGTYSRQVLPSGGGGGAATIADGADVAQGAVADAVVAAGAPGSLSAKLRRLTADLAALIALLPTSLGLGGGLKASTQGTDTTATGALGALNAAVTIDVKGMATVVAEVDAGLVGTATYEYTEDDTNWQAVYGQNTTGAGSVANNSDNSFPNRRRFTVAGASQFRMRCSAYTSGSSAVRIRASAVPVSGIAFGAGGAARATLETGPGSPYSSASTSTADGATGITGLATGAFLWAFNGASHDKVRTPAIFKQFVIAASAAESTIWTPAAGKKFRLMGYALYSDIATGLTFRDNTGGSAIWPEYVAANSRVSMPASVGNGRLSAAANNVLTLQAAVAATINGIAWGVEE